MARKKKEVTEEVQPKKKVKQKKEKVVTGKPQFYYCVFDKQYTNNKKNETPLRFINIRMEEHLTKPDNRMVTVDHAILHYTWFEDEDAARKFKSELLQN